MTYYDFAYGMFGDDKMKDKMCEHLKKTKNKLDNQSARYIFLVENEFIPLSASFFYKP